MRLPYLAALITDRMASSTSEIGSAASFQVFPVPAPTAARAASITAFSWDSAATSATAVAPSRSMFSRPSASSCSRLSTG